ncbi:hypothetical protein RO3G_00583 [Rhizopus delemar RA 99-880]|uniref:Uncharacterized protein n=1 Tax=Rhizopus delemar (strain RA 99-880 / ATCC MYA-4621 / FGSC 9543 / NRRL 43880) TaxID=246409 RepID=I1BI49_RHIO9|nr:hypothetical protein RO3G_00583 [Rhizopus delemar RA 99-880]|eukprot:EIE75879.1 hypothetical protein RO3G_00583 [Rhizopus delemar RA 99-880]
MKKDSKNHPLGSKTKKNISMSSVVTNPRAIFRERVEVRGTVFDDEGDRAQKESGIWWASGKAKRKQTERNVVC